MPEETKKLYRSKEDRVIAGVCGGLGDYFKVDPIFVRLIFIFLALLDGLGVLFYVIFIFVIPKQGEGSIDMKQTKEKIEEFGKDVTAHAKDVVNKVEKESKGWMQDKRKVVGVMIVLVGLFALLNKFLFVGWFQWDIFWRVALIIVGLYIVIKSTKKDN